MSYPMTDYTLMSAGEMHFALGADATKWTTAFRQFNPSCRVEYDTLYAWFCNAIMAGHDAALGNPPLCGDQAAWLAERAASAGEAFGGDVKQAPSRSDEHAAPEGGDARNQASGG